MGLDFNAIKMLLWGKNLGVSFEKTATLGRQGVGCPVKLVHRALQDFGLPGSREEVERCFHCPPMQSPFADEFFRFLGAKEVVSVDYSDFEGATLLHDLNTRFPEKERGRFDLVIDGGTLEHIFDFPAALRNSLELVRSGGHFLVLTGVQNFLGHGFYQFSPELFFRVFSEENGFAVRKMVLYDFLKTDSNFFEVHDPAVTGFRTQLLSNKAMGLAVLAQRVADEPILAKPPFQSDYVTDWERSRQTAKCNLAAPGLIRRWRLKLNPYWPQWLRRLKFTIMHRRQYGFPKLSNHRHFRRLRAQEIFSERA